MQKSCFKCRSNFQISDSDLDFLKKISPKIKKKVFEVPPPKLCPECRQQRRLAFRNERNLYKRKCSASGKSMIAMYSEDVPFPVYDNTYWWSNYWDGKKFGRDFDFKKTFAENFSDLLRVVPKMARIQQNENQNSEFCNCASFNKNSYFIFSASKNEDCAYGTWMISCRDCVDNLSIFDCELCYECINCENSYNLLFSENCKSCSDSLFLKNCIGCQNCFGSVNLRNKQYYFFNKQLSKEEYRQKVQEINFDFVTLEKYQEKFNNFAKEFPNKFMESIQTEESSGNYLENCKNAKQCFECRNLEDCSFCGNLTNAKDCVDVDYYGGTDANELLYECEGVGHGVSRMLFSKLVSINSFNVLYCYECSKIKNLFACTGLKNAEYCILNKQYSKQEYEQLLEKIIQHMMRTGEWGEFFPKEISPLAYNESIAQDYFYLTREEADKQGWQWKERNEKKLNIQNIVPAKKLPKTINETSDEVLNWVIECEKTAKAFKIQKFELEFYRKMRLPLPHFHPDVRHERRMRKRNLRRLRERNCKKCGEKNQTTFSPKQAEKIFCDQCYLSEVI